MTYGEEKIPSFALQPAKSAEKKEQSNIEEEHFDPSPYDRLLVPEPQEEKKEPDLEPILLESDDREEIKSKPASQHLKIIPLESGAIYEDLKVKAIVQKLETDIFIEEDILVPDIKPDLKKILSIEGNAFLSSKEIQVGQDDGDSIRITGEADLHTLYLPEEKENEEVISIIRSRLPFKTDWQVTASPMSNISLVPKIDKIEYTIINERKFRAKVTITLYLYEYAEKNLELFEGIRNQELELMKEKVQVSHAALQKQEVIDISEKLNLKEGSPKPVKILNSHIRVVENHRQITSEKIVINANIIANILYLGEEEGEEEKRSQPYFFQGKTDFTQFILMDQEEKPARSKVSFNSKELNLKIDEDEGNFLLEGTIDTSVEIVTNLEKEIVTDLYHCSRDTSYDFTEKKAEAVIDTGAAEVSVREILSIPDASGRADRVIYINGHVKEQKNTVQQGRVLAEGILEVCVICFCEEKNRAFSVKQDVPFRGTMEIAAAGENMEAESYTEIKDMWFDKISGKQIEINASLKIETAVIQKKEIKLIKNPCFVESKETKRPSAMAIYVARKADKLWDIGKKYKIPVKNLKEVNQLEKESDIKEGTRLLIVK